MFKTCNCIYIYIYLFIYLFIYLSTIYLLIYLFIYLFSSLFIYLCNSLVLLFQKIFNIGEADDFDILVIRVSRTSGPETSCYNSSISSVAGYNLP